MTFPIARLDLTAAGGEFCINNGVDYYGSNTPYDENSDNHPIRTLTARTTLIANRVDSLIDFIDNALNGSEIRGSSDPGTSDVTDSVDTLEKFLAVSHNADGSIKKSAIGDIHPPVTEAAGNSSALKIFVGSQKIKLEAGIGNNKVAYSTDARFAYFDAVIAPSGSQSRVNSPGVLPPAPFTYHESIPFVEGITYYTSLETALDAGARRILALEGTFVESTLTGVYDLGSRDLYLYGIEEGAVVVKLPNGTTQFDNGSVILENIKIQAISGTATVSITGANDLKMYSSVGDANTVLSVASGRCEINDSEVRKLSLNSSSNCTITASSLFTVVATNIDTTVFTNCGIGDITFFGTANFVNFVDTAIYVYSSDLALATAYFKFDKCYIEVMLAGKSDFFSFLTCNIITSLTFVTAITNVIMSNCDVDATVSFAGDVTALILDNNVFNDTVSNAALMSINYFRFDTNTFNAVVSIVRLLNGSVSGNAFNNDFECTDWISDVDFSGNDFASDFLFDCDLSNIVLNGNDFAEGIKFVKSGSSIDSLSIGDNKLNDKYIGVSGLGWVDSATNVIIHDIFDLLGVYFLGDAVTGETISLFTVRNCVITNPNVNEGIVLANVADISSINIDAVSLNTSVTGACRIIISSVANLYTTWSDIYITNTTHNGAPAASAHIIDLNEVVELYNYHILNCSGLNSHISVSTYYSGVVQPRVLSQHNVDGCFNCAYYVDFAGVPAHSGNHLAMANIIMSSCRYLDNLTYFFKADVTDVFEQSYLTGDFSDISGTFDITDSQSPINLNFANVVNVNLDISDIKVIAMLGDATITNHAFLMRHINSDAVLTNISINDIHVMIRDDWTGIETCLVSHDRTVGAAAPESLWFMRECHVQRKYGSTTYNIGTFAFAVNTAAAAKKRYFSGYDVAGLGAPLYAEDETGSTNKAYLMNLYVFP